MPDKFRYNWTNKTDLKDNKVIIWDGNVLTGTFDKKVLGRAQNSIIHLIFNDFGSQAALDFINNLQAGITDWFSKQGFSLGIEDMMTSLSCKTKIEEVYNKTIEETIDMKEESKINFKLNRCRDTMGNIALSNIIRQNRLLKIVVSGSKGSNVNILQIMSTLGQQNAQGGRIQASIGDKTLPCFPLIVNTLLRKDILDIVILMV